MLKTYLHKDKIEAGCDEVGRGCLAGSVFASAVILPKDFYHPLLTDSKKVSEKNRDILKTVIEKEAIAWAVAWVTPKQIDKINILNASILAMHKAIKKLAVAPEFLLVDGNKFKQYGEVPHECIIKGDSKMASIAAASILAKTTRDAYMKKLHKKYPVYAWENNKGYPSAAHRLAVKEHGRSPFHRLSFKLKELGEKD